MTKDEFAGKLDWEGGLYELLSYGLKAEEIEDLELRSIWEGLVMRFDEMELLREKLESILGIVDE